MIGHVRERDENYSDKGVKLDKSISSPGKTISKGSEGEEKWHILHTFCGKHQFLHPKKIASASTKQVTEINS